MLSKFSQNYGNNEISSMRNFQQDCANFRNSTGNFAMLSKFSQNYDNNGISSMRNFQQDCANFQILWNFHHCRISHGITTIIIINLYFVVHFEREIRQ
jgi:hypothetical protein